jgi:hypothetical protein
MDFDSGLNFLKGKKKQDFLLPVSNIERNIKSVPSTVNVENRRRENVKGITKNSDFVFSNNINKIQNNNRHYFRFNLSPLFKK